MKYSWKLDDGSSQFLPLVANLLLDSSDIYIHSKLIVI